MTDTGTPVGHSGSGGIDLRGQWLRLRKILLGVYLLVGGLLLSVAVVAAGSHVSVSTLMGDPLAVAGDLPLYTGIVSTLTGLVWSATAAVCLFTAALPDKRLTPEVRAFLGLAGCTTGLLLADDVFQFHDGFSNRALGIDEKLVYLAYAAIVSALLVRFRATILATDFLPLLIAVAAFGFSVGVDQTAAFHPIFLEDGAKLVGIAGWGTYFVTVCARSLTGPDRPTLA